MVGTTGSPLPTTVCAVVSQHKPAHQQDGIATKSLPRAIIPIFSFLLVNIPHYDQTKLFLLTDWHGWRIVILIITIIISLLFYFPPTTDTPPFKVN